MWILCRKLCGAFCGSNFLCGCSVVWLFALSISSWQASTQSLVMLIQKACFFPLSLTFGDTNLRHHHHQERRLWKHTTPPLSPSSSILILLSSPSSADSGGTQEYILQIMASQHCIWKSNVSDFIFGAIFSSSHSSVLLPWTHVTIETEKKKKRFASKFDQNCRKLQPCVCDVSVFLSVNQWVISPWTTEGYVFGGKYLDLKWISVKHCVRPDKHHRLNNNIPHKCSSSVVCVFSVCRSPKKKTTIHSTWFSHRLHLLERYMGSRPVSGFFTWLH